MTSELVGLSATMLMPKGVVPPTTPCRRVVCVPTVEVRGRQPPRGVGGGPQGGGLPSGRRGRGQSPGNLASLRGQHLGELLSIAYCR